MKIDDLIFQAGTATSQPPPPKEGIPSQWVPYPLRMLLRLTFVPFLWLDLGMQKVARFLIPPPYRQVGRCKKRGNCCHYILIRKPKGLLGILFQWWNTQINGFYLRSQEIYKYENQLVMVMGCRHLRKDGSCGSYLLRPMVCRKWPVIEAFGIPKILKGCGFTSQPKNPSRKLHIAQER